MNELTLIHELPHSQPSLEDGPRISLRTDRLTLAKRRWRGRAQDGREFGFDLAAPLTHGACFLIEAACCYVVEQTPEPVLELRVSTLEEAAALAW